METKNLHREFDGNVWAKEFCRIYNSDPNLKIEEDFMTSWFANAIMAGYDKGVALPAVKFKTRYEEDSKKVEAPENSCNTEEIKPTINGLEQFSVQNYVVEFYINRLCEAFPIINQDLTLKKQLTFFLDRCFISGEAHIMNERLLNDKQD